MTWNVDSTIGDGGQCTDFWLQESSVFRILADYHISLSFKENQFFCTKRNIHFRPQTSHPDSWERSWLVRGRTCYVGVCGDMFVITMFPVNTSWSDKYQSENINIISWVETSQFPSQPMLVVRSATIMSITDNQLERPQGITL